MVTAKELTAERIRCIDSWDSTDNAFEYFLQLNVDRIRAGGVPYTNLPRDPSSGREDVWAKASRHRYALDARD